jgi:hypothetical protein
MTKPHITERTRAFVTMLVAAGFTPADARRILARAGIAVSTASAYRIAAASTQQLGQGAA